MCGVCVGVLHCVSKCESKGTTPSTTFCSYGTMQSLKGAHPELFAEAGDELERFHQQQQQLREQSQQRQQQQQQEQFSYSTTKPNKDLGSLERHKQADNRAASAPTTATKEFRAFDFEEQLAALQREHEARSVPATTTAALSPIATTSVDLPARAQPPFQVTWQSEKNINSHIFFLFDIEERNCFV